MHPSNLLGVLVLALPVVLVERSVSMIVNNTESHDVDAINQKYYDIDKQCRAYLQEVQAMPGWRRTAVAALVVSFVALPLGMVCEFTTKTSVFTRYAVFFSGIFLTVFLVSNLSHSYFTDVVLCPEGCQLDSDSR